MNTSNGSIPIPGNDDGWDRVWIYMIYVIIAIIVGGTNLFVVFVVLRFKALRQSKEYLVILSLSLADGCNMMGFFTAGVRRIFLVYIGKHNALMSPWQCLIVSHNLIWSFADIISGLILLVVSVDRFLSVAYPLHYLAWSTMYVKGLFGSAYLCSFITGTVASLTYVYTWADQQNRMLPALCIGSASLFGRETYYIYYRSYAGVSFALLSIIMYGQIWILYIKHQNRVAADEIKDDNQKKQRLARQRRLTKSLGVSCLCTIFVYVIPYGIGVLVVDILGNLDFLWIYTVTQLNPLCNVLIYYYRQPEMKEALTALFTGKTMPNTPSAWKANISAKRIIVKNLQQQNELMEHQAEITV